MKIKVSRIFIFTFLLTVVLSITSCVSKASIKKLEIAELPDKTEYYSNEFFDPTGMVVKATLEDGEEVEITDYLYEKASLTSEDEYVNIYYGGVLHMSRLRFLQPFLWMRRTLKITKRRKRCLLTLLTAKI